MKYKPFKQLSISLTKQWKTKYKNMVPSTLVFFLSFLTIEIWKPPNSHHFRILISLFDEILPVKIKKAGSETDADTMCQINCPEVVVSFQSLAAWRQILFNFRAPSYNRMELRVKFRSPSHSTTELRVKFRHTSDHNTALRLKFRRHSNFNTELRIF
jgi:hypothetical protein